MNTFPLIRRKWSNEHLMAAVFLVLVLYQIPQWAQKPVSILDFILVAAVGILIDGTANFIRYKRPICGVSAAVTAAMIQVLTPGIPLWAKFLGVFAALILGKHFWGGTGKNIFNPAMVGIILIGVLFPVNTASFVPDVALLPAVLFSLPFLFFRPFLSVGFMTGMFLSLIVGEGFTTAAFISYGVIFWGCLVVTDPVTTTPRPVFGAVIGILAGFMSLYFSDNMIFIALCIIAVNGLSWIVRRMRTRSRGTIYYPLKFKAVVPFSDTVTVFKDMLGETAEPVVDKTDISKDEILRRIKDHDVFGYGGAAFPTYKKMMMLIGSRSKEKHLIINGVECDPGLIHDKWLLRHYSGEIAQGIQILLQCIPFDTVTIAVKETEGIKFPQNVNIHRVPGYYPAGAEKILIKDVLNKKILQGEIPAEKGILVLNVQTVFSIYESVCKNRKADSRFLTVANLEKKSGFVVRVRFGTKIQDIVEGIYPHSSCIFTGGGLMQSKAADPEDIVDKTVNFIAVADFPRYKESPLCSNCGLCEMSCPVGLQVSEIVKLIDSGNTSEAKRRNAERCIQCGCCSYVCLAGKNLSTRIKAAKT